MSIFKKSLNSVVLRCCVSSKKITVNSHFCIQWHICCVFVQSFTCFKLLENVRVRQIQLPTYKARAERATVKRCWKTGASVNLLLFFLLTCKRSWISGSSLSQFLKVAGTYISTMFWNGMQSYRTWQKSGLWIYQTYVRKLYKNDVIPVFPVKQYKLLYVAFCLKAWRCTKQRV